MTTTAGDLAKFASALLEGRIVKSSTRSRMLHPVFYIHTLHQFPLLADEGAGQEADGVGLAYGIGWGLSPIRALAPLSSKRVTATARRTT